MMSEGPSSNGVRNGGDEESTMGTDNRQKYALNHPFICILII